MSWQYNNLFEIDYAYHVTDLKPHEPSYTFLKWGTVDNEIYDGMLVGLPAVFFSTTLWDGDLPETSPYPIYGEPDVRYKRVKVPMYQFDDYDIWRCIAARDNQIRLILTEKSRGETGLFSGVPGLKFVDKKNNPWLVHRNGRWYSNDYTHPRTNFFVNFMVLRNFHLKGVKWDTVIRTDRGNGCPLARDALADRLSRQWASARKFTYKS